MKLKNGLMLALTAFIWGTAFVAQSVGMDYLGPFTFNGVRSVIGGIALLPCIALLRKVNGQPAASSDGRMMFMGGVLCGLLLFVASSLQQIGIQYTTAGKAGFVTACYIIIVPVLGIFLKKRIGLPVWAAVALSITGLYFLCITEGFSVGKGDTIIFLWGEDVLHPVLCVRDRVSAVYVRSGGADDKGHGGGIWASSVCGSDVLWGSLYFTDRRPEKCKSGDRIFDLKP